MIDLIEFHAAGFRIVEERISMQSHNSIVVWQTIDYIASQLLNFQINLLTHTDQDSSLGRYVSSPKDNYRIFNIQFKCINHFWYVKIVDGEIHHSLDF